MRRANSPRRPRPLFWSRRFRHTALSPPPSLTVAAADDRPVRIAMRDSLTFAHIHEFRVVDAFPTSREVVEAVAHALGRRDAIWH